MLSFTPSLDKSQVLGPPIMTTTQVAAQKPTESRPTARTSFFAPRAETPAPTPVAAPAPTPAKAAAPTAARAPAQKKPKPAEDSVDELGRLRRLGFSTLAECLLSIPKAYYDYTHPQLAPQAITVTMSTFGGLILVISAAIFIYILASARRQSVSVPAFTFSQAVHSSSKPPAALNSLGLWLAMMIALTVVNYGYPIVQLALIPEAWVPVIPIGAR